MKSVEELLALKAAMRDKVAVRKSSGDIRIVVGMATCGIAAGARPVLRAFAEEIANEGLGERVIVTQTGCVGLCEYEPIVEIIEKGKDKVTYVKMTEDRVKEIVKEHIKGGTPIEKYTLEAAKA